MEKKISYYCVESMFETCKNVPVVVLKTLDETVPTLAALCANGIPTAEITFRTACAKDAIKLGREQFPEMIVGAGTIVNEQQAKEAVEAGAMFIVSPGLSAAVAKVCKDADIPYIPGCVTPTEIMAALDLGINVVKFFPAHVYGGLKAMKALAGPFPQIKFVPTGGVDRSNIDEYLAFDKILAVGGSFFVKESFDKMKEEA